MFCITPLYVRKMGYVVSMGLALELELWSWLLVLLIEPPLIESATWVINSRVIKQFIVQICTFENESEHYLYYLV